MINYTDSLEGITPTKIRGFCEGWPSGIDPEKHLRILERSHSFFLAVDGETENVVGFVNAVSDGIYSVYVSLIEVLPEYRGRGIGTRLMELILDKYKGFSMIDLTCDYDLVPFYERLGFSRWTGMIIRNRNCGC